MQEIRPRRKKRRRSFLLSAKSRTMSLLDVGALSDEQVYEQFCKLRWPDTDGKAVCPRCKCYHCYFISTRCRYKCSACSAQFSVTSGTAFHGRKIELRRLLGAVLTFVNGVDGMPALFIARELRIDHKTAFVLSHKLREAIAETRKDVQLAGCVELDVAHFGDKARPPNAGRRGKAIAHGRGQNKQCVLAMVERGRDGATIPVVIESETSEAILSAATRHVRADAVIAADEHGAYDVLHARHEMLRINHSVAYAQGPACTNQVESFHSRMRRAELGAYRHIAGRFLHLYAHEIAFKSSRRNTDNGSQARELIEMALNSPISRQWQGYWQKRVA